MQLTLHRTTFTEHSTIGELLINGVFQCYTLEDVVRLDGIKIPGETAIPYGDYTVDITMSPRFKRMLPLILNVTNFVGIRIHPGNAAKDTDGCILVGQKASLDWISNSQAAFDNLFPVLVAAKNRGDTITLQVTK